MGSPLVTSIDQVVANIRRFNNLLPTEPRLAQSFTHTSQWFVLEGERLAAPGRWVGVVDYAVSDYLLPSTAGGGQPTAVAAAQVCTSSRLYCPRDTFKAREIVAQLCEKHGMQTRRKFTTTSVVAPANSLAPVREQLELVRQQLTALAETVDSLIKAL
jgi:hypothetical protein